jgi:glycosyltransferase involved in cell wall biosynthesis
MNIHLENVNPHSNTGPNSFANKLMKYRPSDITVDNRSPASATLCFIESGQQIPTAPLFQRMDGIYINTAQDYERQNANILRTYRMTTGVIFQSEFGKKLIQKTFGQHNNAVVIPNGADLQAISEAKMLPFNKFENVWSCAANWRPHKRLSENVRYFLEHSTSDDCLIIAGAVPGTDQIKHPRIRYAGSLNQNQLFSLYKRSKYFVHLASLDCCPNVVIDARACGAKVICTDSGGSREIAGSNAIVIKDLEWDYEPLDLYNPIRLDFNHTLSNEGYENSDYDMRNVSQKYFDFIKNSI